MGRRSRSKFLGVTRKPGREGAWDARITAEGRRHFLGTWPSEREAARARDRAALHYHLDVRLNFEASSRAEGARSPAELRLEAHRLCKEANSASRYIGVMWVGKVQGWAAQIRISKGHVVTFRCPGGEAQAAAVHDRLAKHFALNLERLNFPDRDLKPSSPEELRRELYALRTRTMTSEYRGVSKTRTGRWAAAIKANGRVRPLGQWLDEEDAAVAYDRACLFFGLPKWQLNFPRRRLRPAAPEALLAEQRARSKATRSSRYYGVMWNPASNRWRAILTARNVRTIIGEYEDEEEAARIRDRVAFAVLGPRTRRNFPREAVKPLPLNHARDEKRAAYKETTTSRYHGVSWSKYVRKWRAAIKADGVTHELGYFDDEVAAARAYDRARRMLRGGGRLNFPTKSEREARARDFGAPRPRRRSRE